MAAHMPMRASSHHLLGVLTFLELHHRMHNGALGSVPQPLRDDAFSMGGYCLDAPQTLPAGGCFWIKTEGPDEMAALLGDGITGQLTVERD